MGPVIRETKEMLHDVLDNAGVIVIYLDVKENVVFCNKKTEKLTGFKHADIVGANWVKVLFHGNNSIIKQDMFRAVLDECMRHKREKDFEGVILDSGRNERLISWNVTPIMVENNQVAGSILIGHDITKIREAGNSVKSIDQTLKNILSSLKDYALYVINLEGNITYFGMGSEIMLGWNKGDIIFKHVNILHNAEEAGNNLPFILEQVRLFGKYEKETALITKTGEAIPVILTANKFLDSDGKHSGYIFIAKDITERKKLEYQAFQAEKLSALGLLSAGIAHEINNPLLVISGRSALLMKEKISQNAKNVLDLINSQADRIHKLVDRILKFSQRIQPAFGPVAINEVIEFILPFAQYSSLPNVKVEIKKSFEKDMRPVKGDLYQLQEVFLNLIINAYQSMPEGGVIKITTSSFRNLFALVQIKDTGLGISADRLKDIFMPFFSTKNDGKGLGLSICHNIIKNHNGSIELDSQVGRGSRFTIKLPFI
ncbi:MAG: PAS domain S-box protein [Candidatus Omnitrophica bacterium]|nr:PAS domain S-box protein [Candidatus Omnitrophota bacterium]MBU1923775.1 PAS domain S-box protein [Candidatus Omnitrophota bacterium]